MRMNAVLSNPKHPEYGQFTVPLPIPHNQYDGIMEALNAMDMGDPLARDCQMDEILGEYPILKRLEGKPVNIDELDYLAKRLDSFCYAQEGAQFQGAAVSYNYSDMTDLINLTFSCQQVTVITDFSDLEQVGRDHYMVLNGGCASKEELDALDGYETALLLIDEGNGVITPYGVVYDNGMRLSQLYDGRHFPQYFYEPPLLTLTVQQSKDAPTTWLYLPAPDLHIKRSLVRAGIVDPADMRLSFQGSEFPDAVDCVLDMESECLEELNKKNYGAEGAEVIVDNCQVNLYGGFAPASQTAVELSKALGSRTVMSGSISRGKNDPSESLQMIERPLMTPDELKAMPKGSFIVAKTGVHPMKVKLRLFLDWGIRFGEPYEVPEKAQRAVAYADKQELEESIIRRHYGTVAEEEPPQDVPAAVGGMNHGMQAEKNSRKTILRP